MADTDSNDGNTPPSNNNSEISNELQGLPLEYLIGAPLAAATKAQVELGKAMVDFVNLLAYGSTEGASGTDGKPVKTLPMQLVRPVEQPDGSIGTNTITVAPPLLGLVPIPSLLIESMDVDFSMQINTVTQEKNNTDASLGIDSTASAGFGPYKASVTVTGKVATQRENTRSTDKTAKYDIRLHAAQQAPTEGMAKLMDLLASTVEPIKSSPAPGKAGEK